MNMGEYPPVLLTSSVVAMDSSVQLKAEKLRIFHTLESIENWLNIFPEGKYVICDGSGYDFSKLVLENFPKANIECLHFENDINLIRIHGKGYGEGEIIRHALAYSKILGNAQWFAKCTAKLWVNNFLQCTEEWNGKFLCQAYFSNVFSFRASRIEYVDTRFYLVDKNFYQRHLSRAHLGIGGTNGISIEDRFLESLMLERMRGFIFNSPPVVCGVGGGSGKYYKNSLTRQLKERLRSRILAFNSRFKVLFNKC